MSTALQVALESVRPSRRTDGGVSAQATGQDHGPRGSLDRLERGRLISSRPEEDTPKGDQPYLLFTVTAEGKRMLSEVRAGAKQLIDALEDFA